MSRNFTQELLGYQREGAQIVCSLAPHEGTEVFYRPRTKGDPQPWMLPGAPYRYSGRECHAVTPNGGGPWAVARLLRF